MSRHTSFSTVPVEHIAAQPTHSQPRLRKSMSRVLSRVISITRKEQPPQQPKLKEGNERAVYIDRGYEVIPRVTSTHLKRSQNGLSEVHVSQNSQSNIRDSHRLPRRVPKEYPFYSHPQISSSNRPALTPSPGSARRLSITTKLSRNQIASFRKASSTSQTSHFSSTTRSATNPVKPSQAVLSTTTRRYPGPRRHLASSRSTAEMRGRSSFESDRPHSGSYSYSSSSIASSEMTPTVYRRWEKGKVLEVNKSEGQVVDLKAEITQDIQPRSQERGIGDEPLRRMILDSGTPTSRTSQGTQRRVTPGSGGYRKPVPIFDKSPCSTTIDTEASPEQNPLSNGGDPTSSKSLDELFDEVMRACLEDRAAVENDVPIPGLWSSDNVNPGSTRPIPVPMKSPSSVSPPGITRIKQSEELLPRFIPSGRSFEPLRKTNTGSFRAPLIPRADHLHGQGDGTNSTRVVSKVKDAIAKFENNINSPESGPSTPVRKLGSIIDRPTKVDSNGLSSESRRMMWEARQSHGIR